jgi:hypothetical protein
MNHPDIEMLTQFALDDPLALDAATLVHITDCDQCTHEIDQIQRVVDATLVIGGRSDLRTLTAPPPAVWDRILAELDGPMAADPTSVTESPPVGLHRGEPIEQAWLFAPESEAAVPLHAATLYVESPSRPSTAWRMLAAALVGLVLGIGATWVITRGSGDATTASGPSGSSTLQGIDGNTGTGEVRLTDTSQGPELTVDFDPGDTSTGFVQVWLLDADTGGMVSLGVLDGTTGTFAVPSRLDLTNYNQVDVSLEPFDGDPAHSKDSLARGPVPTI